MSAARIGITMGDPSGIGPELIVGVLADVDAALRARTTVYGDPALFARIGLAADVRVVATSALAEADAAPGAPSPAGGVAQLAALERAITDARAGVLEAIVTAPISKRQVKAAGLAFPGHTELFADRFAAPRHAMMFAGPRMNVVLATIHCALGDVPRRLTAEGIADAAFLGAETLARRLGVERPRVGVLGLNPHAGEGGLFGDEEARIVAPGIARARAELAAAGIEATVDGPLVPDGCVRDAVAAGPGARPARWDLLVALYHDQGLIPVKLIDFEDAVNVTLGLPIVRTSPDHGVAYDLAGTGPGGPKPRRTSFAAALRLADRLAR